MDDLDRTRRDRALKMPRPRIFRERNCPFDSLSDFEFRRRFRLSRGGFYDVLRMMEDDIAPRTRRSSPLTAAQRLAVTIQVLASNNFQINTSDYFGCSQPTISRAVALVSSWFQENQRSFIQMPSEEAQLATQIRFYDKHSLPGIIGVIDGSHVRIISPPENEPAFLNRKQYHSINIGAICDDTYKFLWLSTRFPGRTHDSRVFLESNLHEELESGARTGRIIGDSAYRSEPFLIKIFPGQNLTPQKIRYNNAICGARVYIEQAFGQLKRMFHSLHAELRYEPNRAAALVTTAVCLRNVAILINEPDDLNDVADEYEQPPGEETVDVTNGKSTMNSILSFF